MRRYWPAILSGALLLLAFYPFSFGFLALAALAPLYYFANEKHRTRRELLMGGFITGIIFTLPLYYYTLAQLVPGLGGEYYTWVIRAASIPSALFESALFALMTLAWARLRPKSPLVSVLIAASAYLFLERIIFFIFGGYYPDSFAAAGVDLPGALALSSLGGMPLVSFVIAAVSCGVGEVLIAWRNKKINSAWSLGAAALACVMVVIATSMLTKSENSGSLTVSLIQTAPVSKPELLLATRKDGALYDPLLRARLTDAERGSEFVIYPYSPFEDFAQASEDAAVGAWLQGFMQASTTVLLWDSVQRGNNVFQEYSVWKNGEESLYQKHDLYAFSDYTPWWAQPLGIEKSPTPNAAGTSTAPLEIGGFSGAGLICSELHQNGYARAQGARTDLLIAVGFDRFFPGEIMGLYSLDVARYRAAENGVPVIRGNLFGPSALIRADGSVSEELPYGKRGVLRGSLAMQKRATLYRYAGEWPVYIACALLLAWPLRRKFKFLYSAGR